MKTYTRLYNIQDVYAIWYLHIDLKLHVNLKSRTLAEIGNTIAIKSSDKAKIRLDTRT